MIEYQEKISGETKAVEPAGAKAKFGVKTELKPVFQVICEFTLKDISFDPSAPEVRTSIETCVLDSLKAICQNTSFLSEKEFNQFTAPLAELGDAQKEETTDLYTQITSDLVFKRLMMRIGGKMDELFEDVVVYASSFRRFVKMYNENADMKIEDYSCFEGEEQLEAFRNGFTNYKQQKEDIGKIETNKDLGLFRLNSKKMQEFIAPSPKRCRELLNEFVPKLAQEQTSELLKKCNADIERLGRPGDTVAELVELFDIIREFNIKMDKELKNIYSELINARKQLEAKVNLAQESLEGEQAKFSKELEEKVPILQSNVRQQAEMLTDPKFGVKDNWDPDERTKI